MREYEEYKQILELWEKIPNKKRISQLTGIPRGTVIDCIKRYGNMAGLEAQKERASRATADPILERIQTEPEVRFAYAYLLGLYLGDGCITKYKTHRVFLLRVALDQKYPNIIQRCMNTISIILPNNKVNKVYQPGCYQVTCSYKHWDQVFPQHGVGMKHLREIKLEPWQQSIVDEHPLEFFRGLYHSDGSRSQNIVKGKNYPRYFFSNESGEIRRMFCDACDRLGLAWTVTNARNISISRREDVEFLDRMVGAKG